MCSDNTAISHAAVCSGGLWVLARGSGTRGTSRYIAGIMRDYQTHPIRIFWLRYHVTLNKDKARIFSMEPGSRQHAHFQDYIPVMHVCRILAFLPCKGITPPLRLPTSLTFTLSIERFNIFHFLRVC